MPALNPTFAGAPSWVLGADRYPSKLYAFGLAGQDRMCELKLSRAAMVYPVRLVDSVVSGSIMGAVCYGEYLYCVTSTGKFITWSIAERVVTRITTVLAVNITATCTMVADGSGSVYFAFDYRLYRVSIATGLVDRTIVIWESARTVELDSQYVYVGEQYGVLEQFSLETGAFVRRLDLSSGSFYAVVSDGSSRVYAARTSGQVYTIAISTLTVEATITVGTNPRCLCIDGNGVVWCSNRDSNTVSIIQNSVVVRTLSGLSIPTSIVFDQRKRVYVGNAGSSASVRRVTRFSMDTFAVEREIYYTLDPSNLLVWNGKVNPVNG
jgi:YVTN family beta-propeller protein